MLICIPYANLTVPISLQNLSFFFITLNSFTVQESFGNGRQPYTVETYSEVVPRVPRGSVVSCLTRNPGVLGSSLTRSSGFFS